MVAPPFPLFDAEPEVVMASNVEVARAYYEAAESRDGPALLEILDPDVELRLTEGLPDALGGTYEGREAALGALRRAAEGFDPLARPERCLPAEEDHVVVLGRYAGVARETGQPFEAAFAHVLHIREGRIDRFTQVTDSRRWADALALPTRSGGPVSGDAEEARDTGVTRQ